MNTQQSIEAFHALAHETRLGAFRLLIKAGGGGVAAGVIAETLDVRPNTLSANLTVLVNSGLISAHRNGRSIIYRAEMDSLRGLLGFVMEDCCGGKPELCQPIIEALACDC